MTHYLNRRQRMRRQIAFASDGWDWWCGPLVERMACWLTFCHTPIRYYSREPICAWCFKDLPGREDTIPKESA